MPATALRLIQNNAPPSKTAALDALRRLAEIGLECDDPHVQDVARRVMQAIDEGRPQDLGRAVGAVARGGLSVAEEERLRQRDAALRRVRSLCYSDVPDGAVAARMIRDFETYQARSWPRDRGAEHGPQHEPAATWFHILKNGLRMPRTPWHLAARLDRPTK